MQIHAPRAVLLLAGWVAIAGCQNYYAQHIYGNESSTHFSVPVDSIFELKQPLTIPADRSRVFFQAGRAMSLGAVDRYSAYCSLDVVTRRPAAQTVAPDRFVVQKVRREYRYQLADAGQFLQVTFDQGGDADYLVVATILELYSAGQPDVLALACASWGLPQDRSYVSIELIRTTLGGFFDLRWEAAERMSIDPQTVRRRPEGPGY